MTDRPLRVWIDPQFTEDERPMKLLEDELGQTLKSIAESLKRIADVLERSAQFDKHGHLIVAVEKEP